MLESDFGPAKTQKITNFFGHFKTDPPNRGLGSNSCS